MALVLAVVLLVSSFGALVAAGDSSSDPAVDVVFLVDRSPSMQNQSAATTSSAMTFAQELESRSVDGRFAVVAYANDRWTTLEQDFTADSEETEDALSTMSYGHNSSENASLAIVSALDGEREPTLAFRPEATTVVVVFTDEDDDGYCELGAEATTALDERGAMLVAVATDPPYEPESSDEPCLTDDTQNHLRVIAEDQVAHGHWTDPGDPDFAAVYDWLGLPAGSSDDDQESEPEAEFERVNHSINRSVVQVGQPVEVTVAVENVGTATGTYQSVLTGDTELLGTQTANLAPGDRHTFTWTVTFDEPEPQLRFFENYQWLGDVEVTAASTPTSADTNESTTATPTATRTVSNESGVTPTAAPVSSSPTATATATATPSEATEDTPTSTESSAAETQTTTSVMTDAGIGMTLLIGGTLTAALLMVGLRRYRQTN